MKPRRRRALGLLLLLNALPVAPAAADEAAGWARRLATQPPGTLLQVTLDDGFRLEGGLASVSADSLHLVPSAGGPPGPACALAAIVAVRRGGGGAGRGWAVGRNVGAVAGAAAGLLFAAVADAVGESGEEVTAAGYAAAGVGMATAGAVGVGGLGALVASGGRGWYELPAASVRARHRLAVHAGLARGDDLEGHGYDGPHLRAWLPRRLSGAVDLGPEAAWSGLAHVSSDWRGDTAEVGSTWSAGLAARFCPAAAGFAPFASAGLGWYRREDGWLGVSLGAGLRWQRPTGTGLDVELRWHSRSSGLDAEPSNGLLTVAAGWTFTL